MDLLFKRYASPLLLLDGLIKTGRFSDFVSELVDIHNEETESKSMWEFYLHKVYDKSFSEFMHEYSTPKQAEKPVDFETAINDSRTILDDFVPN